MLFKVILRVCWVASSCVFFSSVRFILGACQGGLWGRWEDTCIEKLDSSTPKKAEGHMKSPTHTDTEHLLPDGKHRRRRWPLNPGVCSGGT